MMREAYASESFVKVSLSVWFDSVELIEKVSIKPVCSIWFDAVEPIVRCGVWPQRTS